MKIAVLRGVSGAGKSTLAKQMAQNFEDSEMLSIDNRVVICSADDFFMKDGKYVFDAKRLPEAHAFCRGKALGAIEAGAGLVIVDNTNTCAWEFEPYKKLAEQYGAEFETIIVGEFDAASLELYAERNSHGVPIAAIKKMAARFQK